VAIGAVAIGALVIGEVAADVADANARAARVASQTYVAALIPISDESTGQASTLHLIRGKATDLGRTGLEAALGRLVAGAADVRSQLSTIGIGAPSRRSGALINAVLSARAEGARLLAGAIALAVGPSSSGAAAGGGNGSAPGTAASDNSAQGRAASLIVSAGTKFQAADLAYRNFAASLPHSSRPGRLPPSVWILHPAAWSAAAAAAWVAELAGATGLQVRQNLVIVAVTVVPPVVRVTGLPTTTTTSTTTTLPGSTTTSTTSTTSTTTSTTTSIPGAPPSSTTTSTSTTSTTSTSTTTTTLQLPPPESTSILPPTRHLAAVVVVANAGNVTESRVWATASLQPQPPSFPHGVVVPPSRFSAHRIGRLGPGASVYLTLPMLAVTPGGTYTLTVTVGTGSLPTGPVNGTAGLGQSDTVRLTVSAA
jgi:hypothetical protein